VADSQGLPTALVMLDPPRADGDIRVVLSLPAWEEQKPLRVTVGEKLWRLVPESLLETGAGHVIGTYRAKVSS
jgi:hypothetical protein